ncbi:hypothetical protein FRB95_014055 [Tulasnella sp. JGI-2019a]|nr:hypothetical protein FRB95_014055 [Tulasnella sp. JGI-2019a]
MPPRSPSEPSEASKPLLLRAHSPQPTIPNVSSAASTTPRSPWNSVHPTAISWSEGKSPKRLHKWQVFFYLSFELYTFVSDEGGPIMYQWTFVKGGRGFKIKNSESGDNLGYVVVSNTPNGNQSMVCQDDRATEYTVVQSTEGYELRPTADPSLVVTIYNLDAGNNSWVYLEKGPAAGNAYANQQWIFTKPE